MAPLAVSTTSSLVSDAHRLAALELIIAAQGVDLRAGLERLGRGTLRADELVGESAGTLIEETEWNADLEGLTPSSATDIWRSESRGVAGARRPLSEHDAPGI